MEKIYEITKINYEIVAQYTKVYYFCRVNLKRITL